MIDQRLVAFLTICKTKNYTKAAELLNLTQPAVTKQVKYLEEYYGAALFRHRGRRIDLTEAGQILLEYAKESKAKSAVLERKIKNSLAIERRYTIGATLTIGEYILPYILGQYKENHPHLDLIMQVHNTEEIAKKLLNGEIDLGLVEGPFAKDQFGFTKLLHDELVLVGSPQGTLTQKSEAGWNEVLANKLILREEGSGTRKVLEEKLLELGYPLSKLNVYMEIGSLGAIKALVELNLGYTIISKAAIRKEVTSGSLRMIPLQNGRIERDFSFIYRKDSPKEFIENFMNFAIENSTSMFHSERRGVS
jgi:DNA-binding transcriptional LysR family regulator